MTVEERFWAKVDRSGDCWLWTATKGKPPDDYGRFRFGSRKERAHRVAWMLTFGSIPDGLWVLHYCDTPSCVRPEHLFLGDNSINQRDAYRKGRRSSPLGRGGLRPEQAARGEKSGGAKLTEDQVRAIRLSDEPQRVLGVRYGVSGVAIHKIRVRKTWTHI